MKQGVIERVPLALRLVLLGGSLAAGVSWVVTHWKPAIAWVDDGAVSTLLVALWVLFVILLWLLPAVLVVQLLARTIYRDRVPSKPLATGPAVTAAVAPFVSPFVALGRSVLFSKLRELAGAVRLLAFFSGPMLLVVSAVYWREQPSRPLEAFIGIACGAVWLGVAAVISYWNWKRWTGPFRAAVIAAQLFVLLGSAGIGYRLHRLIEQDRCDRLYRCIRMIPDD